MSNVTNWRELYPFAPHYADVPGGRMHYLDEGQGPALLMVHGNPTWSFYWRDLVRALRDRYRVIVPDHLGCGLSEKPSAAGYDFRLSSRIADMASLVEGLGLEDVTLLAHDWGGAIGMGTAVKLPGRFGRFVLFNTAAFTGGRCPLRIRVCRIPGLGAMGVQGLNLFARAALTMAVSRHERMTPPVRAGLLAPYDSWGHRLAVHRFVTDIPLSPSHPSYRTLRQIEEGLAQFRRHPVCLIWGMQDWCFTPAYLERFLDFFPEAIVHRLDDAGHYVIEDAHEAIVPLVEEFLARNGR
ncbi:MAG: alpha/beta fold hydrolase [Thermoguttaceae bacterium]